LIPVFPINTIYFFLTFTAGDAFCDLVLDGADFGSIGFLGF
jgi:hypothetical protein